MASALPLSVLRPPGEAGGPRSPGGPPSAGRPRRAPEPAAKAGGAASRGGCVSAGPWSLRRRLAGTAAVRPRREQRSRRRPRPGAAAVTACKSFSRCRSSGLRGGSKKQQRGSGLLTGVTPDRPFPRNRGSSHLTPQNVPTRRRFRWCYQ